jgi:hypothetical protein
VGTPCPVQLYRSAIIRQLTALFAMLRDSIIFTNISKGYKEKWQDRTATQAAICVYHLRASAGIFYFY